ncbi:MAG: glycine cleavage system aminomethyltransferase GcvT, partial [Chloroflexi bacterium]|nr:glycine cleavage system aminomethyltransferase GcvT [Chloroflexota bacterium]
MPKELRRTPLYGSHLKLGARLVDFAGWEMPIQYTGIIEEHQAVRSSAGIFDVSHMGRVDFTGHGACSFLQRMITNDLARAEVCKGLYSFLCNEQGGIIDDIIAYHLAGNRYFVVVNGANREKDLAWLKR